MIKDSHVRSRAHRRPGLDRQGARASVRRLFFENLEQRLLLVSNWTNQFGALDANRDGAISPFDALVGINELNDPKIADHGSALPATRDGWEEQPFYDVNGDGFLSPNDILIVVNALNDQLVPPTFDLALSQDTAAGGSTNDDLLTMNADIIGDLSGDTATVTRVTAQVDGGERIDVSFQPDRTFSFTNPLRVDGSQDGDHILRFTSFKGRVILSAQVIAFTLDTLAPDAPAEMSLDVASDTGASSNDGVTRDNTPQVTGVAEAGASIELFFGAISVGQDDSDGNWSIDAALLADGQRVLTANATDAAGNVSASAVDLTLVIDTAAPAAPTDVQLTAAADTGVSATDGILRACRRIYRDAPQRRWHARGN